MLSEFGGMRLSLVEMENHYYIVECAFSWVSLQKAFQQMLDLNAWSLLHSLMLPTVSFWRLSITNLDLNRNNNCLERQKVELKFQ
jgi:hypothetical protein